MTESPIIRWKVVAASGETYPTQPPALTNERAALEIAAAVIANKSKTPSLSILGWRQGSEEAECVHEFREGRWVT